MKLQEGDKAPDFSLSDGAGNTVNLKDFIGEKVILYFYPKDSTPGCTTEACNFRDDYSNYETKNVNILGVSPDGEKAHQKFSKKYSLPFPLLCDENHSVAEKYGVWGEKNMYGRKYFGIFRTTFLIDEKGIIEKIFEKVKPKIHSEEILNLL